MKSLKELVKSNEVNLKDKLCGITAGSDKDIVTAFSRIFSDSINIDAYKEELTINEMAIFQSVVAAVQASMSVVNVLQTTTSYESSAPILPDVDKKDNILSRMPLTKTQWSIVGAATTGFVAGVYPNWVTIPAMLATNIVIGWYSSKGEKYKVKSVVTTKASSKQLDVEQALDKIYTIADCIDNAMKIYATNVHNIVAEHTSQTSPTLSTQYGYLLDRLRDLYSVKNAEEQKEALKHLRKTMTNYGYEFLEYSEENSTYFNVRESEYVTELYVESLALVEQGHCIQKGTVFVPKNRQQYN